MSDTDRIERSVEIDADAKRVWDLVPEPGQAREQSTLVEFWIDDRPTGGVTLRVVESGFDALDVSAQERRSRLDDNADGWEMELAAAGALLGGQ